MVSIVFGRLFNGLLVATGMMAVTCTLMLVVCGLGGMQMEAAIDVALNYATAIMLILAGFCMFISLCLCAWAAADATGEWLVTRSPLYQRADREAQFWLEAHMRVCRELDKLKRNKHAQQEQPQVEVVAAPVNDYW